MLSFGWILNPYNRGDQYINDIVPNTVPIVTVGSAFGSCAGYLYIGGNVAFERAVIAPMVGSVGGAFLGVFAGLCIDASSYIYDYFYNEQLEIQHTTEDVSYSDV